MVRSKLGVSEGAVGVIIGELGQGQADTGSPTLSSRGVQPVGGGGCAVSRADPGWGPALLTVMLMVSPRRLRLRGSQSKQRTSLRPNLRYTNTHTPPTTPAANTAPTVVPASHPAARVSTSVLDVPGDTIRDIVHNLQVGGIKSKIHLMLVTKNI